MERVTRYQRQTSSRHKRSVLLLIVGGVVLRVWALGLPVIYDEAFTYTYYASRPWHVLLSDYSYPNNHILHTLLVKLSTGLFGVGRIALRLPALLAGVLVMPLFYLFVRAVFNRYIALMALALVAASGGLVEYSALGRGYSITWLLLVVGLLLGRQFVRRTDPMAALFLGVVSALGLWTIPTMLYSVALLYLWVLFQVLFDKDRDRPRLIRLMLISMGTGALLSLVLYLPVLIVHGPGQLVYHETMLSNSWRDFRRNVMDNTLMVWVDLSSTTASWVGLLGLVGVVFAGFISVRYRSLLAAMVLGAVPMVMLQSMVAPPRVWLYTLFVLHLGSAIALFYLLKLVEEHIAPSLSKRDRTAWASLLLFITFGAASVVILPERMPRYPDAEAMALSLPAKLGPNDRVLLQFPWEAPVEFELTAAGVDRALIYQPPAIGSMVYIVVGRKEEQSWEAVALHQGIDLAMLRDVRMVEDRPATAIFAARYGGPIAGATAP
jgi:4-amino-4-deoxy-L-arabinose transferase-like glycosyltransferase